MKSAAEPQIIGALIVPFVFLEVSAIFWGGPSKISFVIGCAQKRRFGVIWRHTKTLKDEWNPLRTQNDWRLNGEFRFPRGKRHFFEAPSKISFVFLVSDFRDFGTFWSKSQFLERCVWGTLWRRCGKLWGVFGKLWGVLWGRLWEALGSRKNYITIKHNSRSTEGQYYIAYSI